VIRPTVEDAASDPATPCEKTKPLGLVQPCAFGGGDTQFAVLGDSHAGQLRSAFDAVARGMGWRGYSIWRNSCSYIARGRELPEPEFSQCVRFKQDVKRWFAQHPQVKTVFVVGLTRDAGSDPVDGYLDAWKALGDRRIVVVRDTPEMTEQTLPCVQEAVAAGKSPGPACARPRADALPPDPAIEAAGRLGLQTIDLTRSFCDQTSCFPVIGGVLAYKDLTHVTPSFARTLGPYLLQAVRALG